MKKINLKGISEILSEKEMKHVKGGATLKKLSDDSGGTAIVDDSKCNDICTSNSTCGGSCSKCKDVPNWAGMKTCTNV